MRRFVIASHQEFALGLRKTVEFLSGKENIYAISAYVDNTPLEKSIKDVFSEFDKDDEVVILTDMLQGSVNQKFYPYISEHVHLICGVNVPCAMALTLHPDDEELTADDIREIVEESRSQIIYVNEYKNQPNESDE